MSNRPNVVCIGKDSQFAGHKCKQLPENENIGIAIQGDGTGFWAKLLGPLAIQSLYLCFLCPSIFVDDKPISLSPLMVGCQIEPHLLKEHQVKCEPVKCVCRIHGEWP